MSVRDKQLRFCASRRDTAPDYVVNAALAGVITALRELANDPRLMRKRFNEADGLGPGLFRRRNGNKSRSKFRIERNGPGQPPVETGGLAVTVSPPEKLESNIE